MNLFNNPLALDMTRRHFFRSAGFSLGATALATLQAGRARRATRPASTRRSPRRTSRRKCKNIIYLHMVGGPAQMDLYDYKPKMEEYYDKDLPEVGPHGPAAHHDDQRPGPLPDRAVASTSSSSKGQCGMWMNDELLPYTREDGRRHGASSASMHTEAINHEPAITYMQTGNQVTGRPCLGAWTSYGLGSLNQNLPTFVVMVAKPTNQEQVQAISARLWQSGYLPGEHAAVSFRAAGDPILFINNPPGVTPRGAPHDARRPEQAQRASPPTNSATPRRRRAWPQYEMAYRMQASVPELTEPREGAGEGARHCTARTCKKPGTFANTALMARRLVERGVRFVQVYHNNWDHHGNLAGRMPDQCKDVDQPCWALIQDLKRKGLFDARSSSGAASSAARSTARAGSRRRTTAAITTRAASRCGWPAAARRAARSTARPTTSATTS